MLIPALDCILWKLLEPIFEDEDYIDANEVSLQNSDSFNHKDSQPQRIQSLVEIGNVSE